MHGTEAGRIVSRAEVVALSLKDVIGSGVRLLPAASGAVLAGPASRFNEPGGACVYAREAWGDLAGFEVGWMTFLPRIATLGGATLVAGLAVYALRRMA